MTVDRLRKAFRDSRTRTRIYLVLWILLGAISVAIVPLAVQRLLVAVSFVVGWFALRRALAKVKQIIDEPD